MTLPRLSRSGIEYLTHTWTPYSGCHNWENGVCSIGKNCWARRITKRFKNHYPNGFEPTFYPEAMLSPRSLKKPARIGVCFMGDLFGDWINPDQEFDLCVIPPEIHRGSLKQWIQTSLNLCPQHTFLFLTKCPWNLIKWSPFPDNGWVGVTATNIQQYRAALVGLAVIEARVKYISFEPLLEYIPIEPPYTLDGINWVILGGQTKPEVQPPAGAVNDILNAADIAGIPIFMKKNLAWQFHKEEMPRWK